MPTATRGTITTSAFFTRQFENFNTSALISNYLLKIKIIGGFIMELLKVYLTNLGKYNEGALIGEWLALPTSEEEIASAMLRIGVKDNTSYEEYFITDYESNYNLKCEEYTNIYELNKQLEELENALNYANEDAEIITDFQDAYCEDLEEITRRLNNYDYIFYKGCSMLDVAEELFDECYGYDLPDHIKNYIDYEAFARDLSFDGYEETTNGVMLLQ